MQEFQADITVLEGEEFRIILPSPSDENLPFGADQSVWGIMDQLELCEFLNGQEITTELVRQRIIDNNPPEVLAQMPSLNELDAKGYEMTFMAISGGFESFVCALYNPTTNTEWDPVIEYTINLSVIDIPEPVKVYAFKIPNLFHMAATAVPGWLAFRRR